MPHGRGAASRLPATPRAGIDLALLFPAKPCKEALDFLGYVGVKTLWFDANMASVGGDVELPRV